MSMRKTDWTKYYVKKRNFFSTFTQKYTLEYICNFYQSVIKGTEKKVLELGGGNSCFVEQFVARNIDSISQYDIIDNNELAIKKFCEKSLNIKNTGMNINLSQLIETDEKYDFVYSVGLIEHFTKNIQKLVVKNHFAFCKSGGYVMLTFPTPTIKYRVCRKLMEFIGVWQFWDEVPLFAEEIEDLLCEQGEIIHSEINRKLFLTQSVVLVRKVEK